MDNKSYCIRAFNHIYNDSKGTYRLCCHASAHPFLNPLEKYNANTHLPFEVFDSIEMEGIRDDMVSGKPIDACQKCYMLEERGAVSPRQRSNAIGYSFEPTKVSLKLRIFGNSCSLSCYMCTPYNSSTRTKEFREMGIQRHHYDFGSNEFEAKPKRAHFDLIAKDILKNIHRVNTLYITGGEPFQLPKHYEFLEQIPEKYARDIHVRYDTNLTVLEYKGKSIFETLKKFRSFSFMVSSDHYGDKLAYIRYPIDVNQFERNLEYVQTKYNAIGRIGCTVSMLNVEDLDDILPYYENKFGIPNEGYSSSVLHPKILSIQHFYNKEKLLQKYDNYPMDVDKTIISSLKQPADLREWNKGIHYLERLDKHRGTDFRKLWPDYEYINVESGDKVSSELREQLMERYQAEYFPGI